MATDAKLLADKYISRAGGSPRPSVEEFSRDLLIVSDFILWHDERNMFGGVIAKDAFAAFCRITNVEPHVIRKIVRPTP